MNQQNEQAVNDELNVTVDNNDQMTAEVNSEGTNQARKTYVVTGEKSDGLEVVPQEQQVVSDEEEVAQMHLDMVSNWTTHSFNEGVLRQARARTVDRKIKEKKQALRDRIDAAKASGDIDEQIESTTRLQTLEKFQPEPIPDIPSEVVNECVDKAKREVTHAAMLLDSQMPTLKNQRLMNAHPHSVRNATDEERLALKALSNFQDDVNKFRVEVSNWQHAPVITDPLHYLLNGKRLVTVAMEDLISKAAQVTKIVKAADATYRDVYRA